MDLIFSTHFSPFISKQKMYAVLTEFLTSSQHICTAFIDALVERRATFSDALQYGSFIRQIN